MNAIQTCLALDALFGFPLPQAIGSLRRLIAPVGLGPPIPDSSALIYARRGSRIEPLLGR